ncbi:TPA: hypothetical protein ACH3X1_008111 [Trebouxia sp. C0004]
MHSIEQISDNTAHNRSVLHDAIQVTKGKFLTPPSQHMVKCLQDTSKRANTCGTSACMQQEVTKIVILLWTNAPVLPSNWSREILQSSANQCKTSQVPVQRLLCHVRRVLIPDLTSQQTVLAPCGVAVCGRHEAFQIPLCVPITAVLAISGLLVGLLLHHNHGKHKEEAVRRPQGNRLTGYPCYKGLQGFWLVSVISMNVGQRRPCNRVLHLAVSSEFTDSQYFPMFRLISDDQGTSADLCTRNRVVLFTKKLTEVSMQRQWI